MPFTKKYFVGSSTRTVASLFTLSLLAACSGGEHSKLSAGTELPPCHSVSTPPTVPPVAAPVDAPVTGVPTTTLPTVPTLPTLPSLSVMTSYRQGPAVLDSVNEFATIPIWIDTSIDGALESVNATDMVWDLRCLSNMPAIPIMDDTVERYFSQCFAGWNDHLLAMSNLYVETTPLPPFPATLGTGGGIASVRARVANADETPEGKQGRLSDNMIKAVTIIAFTLNTLGAMSREADPARRAEIWQESQLELRDELEEQDKRRKEWEELLKELKRENYEPGSREFREESERRMEQRMQSYKDKRIEQRDRRKRGR